MIQSELVQRFNDEQRALMQRVASLPEEAASRVLERGGWSIKDFVGHIAASQKAILFAARKIAEGMVDGSSERGNP
jgi:uncharacterized damage-inducible protein DinB